MTFKSFSLDEDYIVHEYRNGTSIENIASDLGVCWDTISRRVKKLGLIRIKPRGVRETKVQIDCDLLKQLRSEGFSQRAIAEKLGYTEGIVYARCRECGMRGKNLHRIGFTEAQKSEIIQKYQAGATLESLAQELGVTDGTISKRLKKWGCSIRSGLRLELDNLKIIDLFNQGVGTDGIAKEIGCSDTAIRTRLKKLGLGPRNRSEQQQARMDRASPEEKLRLLSAAHAAATGRSHTWEERCKRAKTHESSLDRMSDTERQLANLFRERGIEVEHQTAIGAYNCDLTCAPVAVEIWGGGWHWYGEHRRIFEERSRYIMDCGWNLLIVPITKYFPLTPAVADYLVFKIEEFRANPPPICEYWVIWGAGEFTTGGCADDKDFSIGKPICNPINRTA
jgi:transposase/very-short-patch-repair endonuclease